MVTNVALAEVALDNYRYRRERAPSTTPGETLREHDRPRRRDHRTGRGRRPRCHPRDDEHQRERGDARGHRPRRRAVHLGLRAQPAAAHQAVREGQDLAVERRDRPRLVDRSRPGEDRGRVADDHDHRDDRRPRCRPEGHVAREVDQQGVAAERHRVAELEPQPVHARRAGRAGLHGQDRRDGAVDRRQVLRRHPGHGRGPPRRGLRQVPRHQAARALPDQPRT